MHRRHFIKTASFIGGISVVGVTSIRAEKSISLQEIKSSEELWFNRSMRWAQLAFVENDPGHYDPDFWLTILNAFMRMEFC